MRARVARGLLLAVSLGLIAGMAACGGEKDLTCDDPRRYQEAVQNERLRAPEDLDAPQPYLEMPVPVVNKRPAPSEGSPCLDLPPRISPTE